MPLNGKTLNNKDRDAAAALVVCWFKQLAVGVCVGV